LCNLDGSEPVQIGQLKTVLGREPSGEAKLSGDEKAVAYCAERKKTIPARPDSIGWVWNIFVQDLDKDTGRVVGKGYLVDWAPDRKYMLVRPKYYLPQCVLAPTSSLDRPMRQFESRKIDSSFTQDSKSVLYADTARLWSMSIESGQRTLLFTLPKGFWWVREMPDGKSIGIGTRPRSQKGVWTSFMVSKSGKGLQRLFEVRGDRGEMFGAWYSPDMRTLVVVKREVRNKIVIIDNFR
jgi:hypothetical protein